LAKSLHILRTLIRCTRPVRCFGSSDSSGIREASICGPSETICIAVSHGVCGKLRNMPKTNANIAEAAASILKAKSIIHGPFKPLTDQIIDQDVKLPLVKLFEVADLHNQALEKLQIELEKLARH